MRNYSFLLIVLVLMSVCNNSQDLRIPMICKTEMVEDINFLYWTIKAVNPHLAIRQQVTKTDLCGELDSLWKCADKLNTFEDFYYLANRMLILCQDQHNSFWTFYPEGIEHHNPYIHPQSTVISEICELRYDKYSIFNNLEINYIDGDYFFVENIYNTQTNEILIPASAKLLKVNNTPIDDYISQWNRKVDNSIRWDFEKQKYYTLRLYSP